VRPEVSVPSYIVLFSYTGPAWQRMLQTPGDRTAAISAAATAVGASVQSVRWMLGPYDGLVLLDAPDSVTAAAVSVTAMSTGSFAAVQTHELFSQDQLQALLGRAADATRDYTPPGG
jgi:uncharacterized protein with GYD domain